MQKLTSYFSLSSPSAKKAKVPPAPPRPLPVLDSAFVAQVAMRYMKPQAVVLELARTMMSAPALPFAWKYQPMTDKDMLDKHLKTVLKEFIGSFQQRQEEANEGIQGLVLVGPSGSGKTVAVRAIARSLNLILLEMGTKEPRHSQALQRVIGEASQTRKVERVSSNALLLLDDVDVVFEGERGFHHTAYDLVAKSKCPVVMTAEKMPQDFEDKPKLKRYDMKPVSETEAGLKLCLINKIERLDLPDSVLPALYRCFNCDIRALLNSLQLNHLHLMLGLRHPVQSIDILANRVTARSEGFNWLSEGHCYSEWLDFVHLNAENSLTEDINQQSAMLDLISLYDPLGRKVMESEEEEWRYRLPVYTRTLDECMGRMTDCEKKLILMDHGTAPKPVPNRRKSLKSAHSFPFPLKKKAPKSVSTPSATDSFLD